MIAGGLVSVAGAPATKAATAIGPDTPLVVREPEGESYVSRGGHKLAGGLDAFGYDPAGLRALDAGASTGGFTDVLLRRGAREVVAVDVGYGQLAWSLRSDERVRVVDRTNVRSLTLEQVGEPVELVVADLSFIPLGVVLPALLACTTPQGDLLLMVKPQFEVGRERLPSGGVVRDPELRAETVRSVAGQAGELGLGVRGVTASPLPGPSGNVEYFLWLTRGAPALVERALLAAVAAGPA